MACRLITGAFKSTATDTLEAHAFIPPLRIRLEDTCHHKVLRLASLPATHPLYTAIRTPLRRIPKCHRSAIHSLALHFAINARTIECIKPHAQHLNWLPTFTTFIAKNKEEAASYIRTRTDDIKIFSDGSGFKEKIGAAAIRPDTQDVLYYQLGSSRWHTVFEAELVGILLALKLIDKY